VLLVDEVKPEVRKVGESLPGAARPLLRDLNLLSIVEDGSHLRSFGNVSAWGSSELAATDFINDPHGAGWHLDRARFDAALRAAAQAASAALQSGRVEAATVTDDGWQIALAGEAISARWLIDATGRRALVARTQNVMRQRDDSLVALCAWAVTPATDTDTRTLVESAPDGWWYTARLPDNTRVAVLHVEADNAAAILHTTGAWQVHLARTTYISRALAGASFIDEPRGAEACGARLDQYVGNRWLATGDAALSFDPLSSQGILNALYTGMKAGQAVDASLSGDLGPINVYATRLESIRAAYLNRHRLVYQTERRWLDHPFWARRQSSLTFQNRHDRSK
jgi:flavin-dependent dehydrogenase